MQLVIDVITIRDDMYKALIDSEENQSIIGIASKELGPGMFMTSVREIVDDGHDLLIVLNSYDTSGYFLEKNKVYLSSITGIVPFKAMFMNPFLKEVEAKERQEAKGDQKQRDYIF
jgi:hypothetical protein